MHPGMKHLFFLLLLFLLSACESEKEQLPPTLLDAAEQGNLPALDDYLKGSSLVDMRNACKWTPLMLAALNGHYEATEKLVDKGAEIDLVDKGGYSAMMLAASNNFPGIVELLLRHGADIDRVEHTNGWTALIWAAKRGHKETVESLLKNGADRNIQDFEKQTALDHARKFEHPAIVTLLQ